MKTGRILLLCILAAALVSTVVCHSGPIPVECCVKYHSRMKKDYFQSYYWTDEGCAKSGVILMTAKSYRICVDPNQSWVKAIMKYLDEKNFK